MNNGVLLAVLSSLVFSVMNALVKGVSDRVPSTEIAFFRSIIGTLLILALMRLRRVPFSTRGVPLLALRGATGGLYLICYFYAIAHMPLADASILAHLSPAFSILLAALVLKEPISVRAAVLIPPILLGTLLIVHPFGHATYGSFAGMVGMASALFAAMASIAIRRLSRDHHTYEIVFYFLATTAVISVPLMWRDFVIPDPHSLLYLLAIGVVSLLGQISLTQAFTHESTAVVAVTRYIGIVFNATWGWLFWQESLDLPTLAGGALIIGSCVSLSQKAKPQTTRG